ncbi:gamma subclass chorismate mutase AroQ [Nitrosomonas communis]|uniref:gamma subclass chorismate mutase AroQ n=1 Tax=Nitrosomonas communis TaxID=44574 RepID=UPI003D2C0615
MTFNTYHWMEKVFLSPILRGTYHDALASWCIAVRKLSCILCALLVLFANTAVAQVSFLDQEDQVRQIFALIDKRLELMQAVAAWKHVHQRPVLDDIRESSVLEATVAQAQTFGISAEPVRELFTLQMRLAREMQQRFIDQWTAAGVVPAAPPDLSAELRPQLDKLGVQLMQTIYLAMPEFQRQDFHSYYAGSAHSIAQRGVEERDINALFDALARLRLMPVPALQRITASRILRIGTTGDYAPFTLESRGMLTGADIAAAISLAAFLDAEPQFVRTTWATLMTDYQGNRFDLAIGGISITIERTPIGSFSIPYYRGGKTPIVRCGTESRFGSLNEINQAGVRVIVNPGGTNERFVREHLHNVQPILYTDNRTIFEEIATGRADVMVTDDVEVDLQTQRDSRLCRATAEVFTQYDKALLIACDPKLITKVDAWLSAERESGKVSQRLKDAFSSENSSAITR